MNVFSRVCVAVAAAVALTGVQAISLRQEKNRPVSKVITLLKDMQSQLEKEQELDEGTYDKMACWCDTNDKEKTKAIADAEARITQLTSTIEEASATVSRLTTEISNLNSDIAKNQASLAEAASIRQKEKEAFSGEEKDMLQSISALKSAIVVLSKHHAPPASALLNIGVMLRHLERKYQVNKRLSGRQRTTLASFLQEPGFFGAKPTFKAAFAPQSGEIFGVLENMRDNFEANLSDAQKEETARQAAFDQLKAAKEAEIAAAQEQVATKNSQLADTQEKLAQAKEDIEDTRNSLSADQKYLMDLKTKCQMTDAEWAERQKTRQAEIQAVSQALAVLSSDDAHDTFTRTFNNGESFLQRRASTKKSSARARAASLLIAAAKKAQDPSLLGIASSVKLDAFTRVKEAIDGMITALKKEKADEIRQKDWCVAETNKNERQTELTNRDKSALQVKIEQLTQTQNALTSSIAQLNQEIADLQKEIQKAGEDREAENADFQTTIKDQQETQRLLKQAIEVLNAFYAKKAALVSTARKQEPVGPPPPAGFTKYENQAGSQGVIAMITQILTDAQQLEKDAVHDEQDAQSAYETFVKDSNGAIEMKQRDITNKSEQKAKAEADLTQSNQDLAGENTELAQLAQYAQQLHTACDFVVNNFEIRQAARDQEVDALDQAKAILSGMQSS